MTRKERKELENALDKINISLDVHVTNILNIVAEARAKLEKAKENLK